MRKKSLSLLILCTVLLVGCTTGGVNQHYTVVGRLFEKGTTTSIPNVIIVAEPVGIGRTGAQGGFQLTASGSVTITPVGAGWRFEPSSITVRGPQKDLKFDGIPTPRTPIYEDENVEIVYVGCEPSDVYGFEDVLVFAIKNKTSSKLSLRADFALDGKNLGHIYARHDLTPLSETRMEFLTLVVFPSLTPEVLTGTISVTNYGNIDYDIDFVNLRIIYD